MRCRLADQSGTLSGQVPDLGPLGDAIDAGVHARLEEVVRGGDRCGGTAKQAAGLRDADDREEGDTAETPSGVSKRVLGSRCDRRSGVRRGAGASRDRVATALDPLAWGFSP